MKFSKNLIELLKNYNTLNQGIKFLEGDKLSSISVNKATYAEATLHPEDMITHKFSVFDLSEFMSTLSLFKQPELVFKDEWFEIDSPEEQQKVRYGYAIEATVLAPDKGVPVITPEKTDIQFNLTKVQLDQLMKAAAVMKLKDLGISKKGVRVFNNSSTNFSGNEFNAKVDIVTDLDQEFVLKIDNMKIIPANYTVKIWTKGAVEFSTTELPIAKELRYVTALEVHK